MNEHKIINIVCDVYDTTFENINKKNKCRKLVEPRQACMYFLRHYTRLTLQEIGDLFTGLSRDTIDHSNVVYSMKKYKDLIYTDKDIRKKSEEIKDKIIYGNSAEDMQKLEHELSTW